MDLIDRQEAIKALCKAACGEYCNIPCDDVMAVQNLPSVDAVEVVRCKDCKYQDKGENESESWNVCKYRPCLYFSINDDDYCSNGERKDE